ncbi:MAG TPA: IPT/TIG domain-containing protein [Gaiellaceae bacterium]|nr:IPT/TIG domain-containing protein [Gaiellaceae bacterium]
MPKVKSIVPPRRPYKSIAILALMVGALVAAPIAASSDSGPAHAHIGNAGLPTAGVRSQVLSPQAYGALQRAMSKPHAAAQSQSVAAAPTHGTFRRLVGSASTESGHAYWNGSSWVTPGGTVARSLPKLLVPSSPGGQSGARSASPSAFYGSTQVDSVTLSCDHPDANEPSVAQSSDNPNDVVVAAQAYMDSSGACDDSNVWVFYSHDGGQHWREQIMPGLTANMVSGDPSVTYDPKHHVFVYAFLQFSRSTTANTINTETSSDGTSWSNLTILDSNAGALDKPMITVNQDPSSTNYGRVAVAWRDDHIGTNAFIDAFSDNGGANWTGSSDSVNIVPDCGNGASPAFDANGDLMVAWWDCNGGSNIDEQLSTDGGANWTAPSNTVISAVNDIGSGGPGASGCELNNGGSAFRCDSFPSLVGDPNSGDAGSTAFFVVFATWESTTQSSVTANVSQLHGLSTVNGGGAWNGGAFAFDYMAFKDFGDKFFPWASFSPSGRLNVGYSDREGSASTINPNGLSYSESQTEASSLTNLRNDSFIAYGADGTLGNPGSIPFIGDYGGSESQDDDFDTFPVWTDVRNGSGTFDVRTMDLCYADCPTFLQPDTPVPVSRTAGSTFTDRYQINTDENFGGAGQNFWNAVGIRTGTDGSTIDDDLRLWGSRYFTNLLASSAFGPPINDYVVENDNFGHATTQPYFLDVHNFSTVGGSYTVEWSQGHITVGTSIVDSMASNDVLRVYDVSDVTGTKYYLGVRPSAGDTSGYSLSVHLNGSGSYQGRPQSAADSGNVGPGLPAFVTVNTGASPSGFDGVVVQNDNSGAGSYTLYRDTVAPSGTIQVDGGAASTNSTTASLTLSATNATSGDPVSDMAFSVDGGGFGAFQPYSTSATVPIPAVEGSHTVAVEYRNGAGAVSTSASDSVYLVTAAPTISSVSPNGGPTAGGNTVTINGAHLAPGATVKFGSSAAVPTTFVTGSKVTAVAPAGAAGTVQVAVTTPAGTSAATNSDLYAYGAPTITGVSANAGSTAGGNTVTILGTGFVPGTTVKFGSNSSGTVTFVSPTKLTAVAPAGAAGTVQVAVTTPGGTSAATNADLYAYGVPAITSVSPPKGPVAGGNTVTINGSGFVPGATVNFGSSASGTVTFVSSGQLTAVAPAGAAGTVDVTVTTPAGTSGATAADKYKYLPPPCIVPKLKGKKVKAAKHALKKANCGVGKIKHKHSASVKKGHVISSKPKHGKHLPHGAKVKLVVSSGP